jgi:ribosomal protein S18 acetylase RimI-like enzyme
MISLWRWGRWKPKPNKPRSTDRPPEPGLRDFGNGAGGSSPSPFVSASASVYDSRSTPAAGVVSLSQRQRALPRPALRWVAAGRVAVRAFDFDADADAVCAFQPETYGLNFPDFEYSNSFAGAFRHDLRRAALEPNNALFVLDDGRETKSGDGKSRDGKSRDSKSRNGHLLGFLWVVVCQNNWTGERYGYVNNLFVAPQRRGEGLGRELMNQADDFFRSRGVKRVRLTVTTSNQSAVALYEKSGYRVQRWEMEKEL